MTKKEKYYAFLKGEVKDIIGISEFKDILLSSDEDKIIENKSIEILEERYPGEGRTRYNGLRGSVLTSFFTPKDLAILMVNAIPQENIKKILEPSAGTGAYIEPIKSRFPGAIITAVEKEAQTIEILQEKYPDVNAIHTPFEKFAEDGYDLAISNIPFGDLQVFDKTFLNEKTDKKTKAAKILSMSKIHNYYHTKGLDKVRDGGYVAYLVTSSFADTKSNEFVRRYMIENANLKGMVRFPNNTFENTEVVTDLLIFQKDINKKKSEITDREELFTKTEMLRVDHLSEKEFPINALVASEAAYIIKGDFDINHMHNRESLTIKAIGSMEEILSSARNTLQAQANNSKEITLFPEAIDTTIKGINIRNSDLIPLPLDAPLWQLSTLEPGNIGFHIHQGKGYTGIIQKHGDDYFLSPEITNIKDPYPIERTQAIVGLLNTYNLLVQADVREEKENSIKLRSELNRIYDTHFGFQFGLLQDKSNLHYISMDKDAHKILGLELWENGKGRKSDVFTESQKKEVKLIKPQTISDAINQSLNKFGNINEEYISQNHDIRAAVKEGKLFIDPFSQRLVTQDDFRSGPIQNKIEALESNRHESEILQDQNIYQNHLELLEEVRPYKIPVAEIGLNLGENWIDKNHYESFAEDFLGSLISIGYRTSNDTYNVQLNSYNGYNTKIWDTYAVETKGGAQNGKKFNGLEILELALNDKVPNLTYEVEINGEKARKTDSEGMEKLSQMIDTFQKAFEDWVIKHPTISKEVEDKYYRLFVQNAQREYSGDHLTFEGLRSFEPRKHQKDTNWQLLVNNGGIVDHVVGSGKTLIMVNHAHELKRLGLANKPLITAMKANVHEIYKTYKECYPNAKVLYPSDEDFKEKNLKQLLYKIANNDWEAVIISHNQLQRVPKPIEIERKIIEDELSKLDEDLKAIEGGKISRGMIKGLLKRKETLTAKLEKRVAELEEKRMQGVPDFKELGFDHLIVDESQVFKNLPFTTRQDRVSGLGNQQGSNIAFDMLMSCRTVQETIKERTGQDDKGVTFLSGTPISNSLVELPLLFRYLTPSKMENMGLVSMDAWLKTYARKSSEFEVNVDGQLKMKERYREFIKVPELAQFYKSTANVLNKSQLNFKVPKIITELVNIDPTPAQEAYGQELILLAKNGYNPNIGVSESKENKSASMLLVTNLGRKMSLDLRVIDQNAYSEEQFQKGKLHAVAEKVYHHYQETKSLRGTQIIFSDLGTPSKNFNVYDGIKNILVNDYKIEEKEIQFIHNHQTKTKKPKLFEKVNNGEVRIVFGSTQMLGTGTNIQERVVAMHHVDTPWRPSDMEQRVGRGQRQGNRNEEVHNYVYATNKTINAYQFQLISAKQLFIDQIRQGTITSRKIDEGAIDADGSMNFMEFVALTSGDTKLLEYAKAKKEFETYERYHENYRKDTSKALYEIEKFTSLIETNNMKREDLAKDIVSFKSTVQMVEDPNNKEEKKIKIEITDKDGVKMTDQKEIGSYIIREFDHARKQTNGSYSKVGDYGAFKIGFETINFHQVTDSTKSARLIIRTPTGNIIKAEDKGIAEKPGSVARQPIDLINKKLKTNSKNLREDTDRFKEKIIGLKLKVEQPFKYQGKFDETKEKFQSLKKELDERNKETALEMIKEKEVNPDQKVEIEKSKKDFIGI